MRNFTRNIALVILASTLLFACSKTETAPENNPLEGLTKLQEGYAIGAATKVEIWGERDFFVGYNKLTIVAYDSLHLNTRIEDAHIYLKPLMTMNSGTMPMQHATPKEDPAEESVNGVFPGALAFVMPTMGVDTWQLGVQVHNHTNDKTGLANFQINVQNPTTASLTVFTSLADASTKLVLCMLPIQKPVVGINDIEFALYRRVSKDEWPADDAYTIEITPEMPSMGHGSPNNVNPITVGNGHYKGKVNFTMTGEWKINVVVKKDGQAVSQNLGYYLTF